MFSEYGDIIGDARCFKHINERITVMGSQMYAFEHSLDVCNWTDFSSENAKENNDFFTQLTKSCYRLINLRNFNFYLNISRMISIFEAKLGLI